MRNLFLRMIGHLLPKSSGSWGISLDRNLRKLFYGLTGFLESIKLYIDLVLLDLFPISTRELIKWREQFSIDNTITDEDNLRANIKSAWTQQGGQSPSYLQKTLQSAGFNVYLHEGFQNTIDPPVWINPNDFFTSNYLPQIICGNPNAICGNPTANCGSKTFHLPPLVNRGLQTYEKEFAPRISCGNPNAICGNPAISCGNGEDVFTDIEYSFTENPNQYPYVFYVGGVVFGDTVQIPSERRKDFEGIILKLKPVNLWTGLFIEYV